jgi:hypothetical protein
VVGEEGLDLGAGHLAQEHGLRLQGDVLRRLRLR